MLEKFSIGGYIISIFAQILGSLWWKNAPQPAKSNIGQPPSKVKKLCRLNIGMWGVYPEVMTFNVGVLCSDINLGERILRKGPDGLISKYTLGLDCRGFYLKIRSPKLISKHNTPTLQAIASGKTSHMPMFGQHNFFDFKRPVEGRFFNEETQVFRQKCL